MNTELSVNWVNGASMAVGDKFTLDGVDMVVTGVSSGHPFNTLSESLKMATIAVCRLSKAFKRVDRQKYALFANSKHKPRQVRMRGK